MLQAFQQRRWPLVIVWVLIIAAIVAAPVFSLSRSWPSASI